MYNSEITEKELAFITGLNLLIGLPRSGKTTLIKNYVEKMNHDVDNKDEIIIIKNNEFDGEFFFSNFIGEYGSFIVNFFSCNPHINTVIIDSVKDILYEGSSLRKGGLSNYAYKTFNDINMLTKSMGKKFVGVVSPSSQNRETINEILTLSASCCDRIVLVNQNHKIFFDDNKRNSINQLSTFLFQDVE